MAPMDSVSPQGTQRFPFLMERKCAMLHCILYYVVFPIEALLALHSTMPHGFVCVPLYSVVSIYPTQLVENFGALVPS